MTAIMVGMLAGALVGVGWWLLGGGVGHRLQALIRVRSAESGSAESAHRAVGQSSSASQSGSPGRRSSAGQSHAASRSRSARQRRTAERRAATTSRVDALAFDLDLVSICLQSGLPTERALSLAASAGGDRTGLDRLGRSLALGEVDDSKEELAAVGRLVLFSRSTGVALAPLLRGLAGDLRRAEHRRRQIAAARLGVELVIPLGVCILPAFILLGVVPVVLSLVDDMGILFS